MITEIGAICSQAKIDLENIFYLITFTNVDTTIEQYLLIDKNTHVNRFTITINTQIPVNSGNIDINGDIYFSVGVDFGVICKIDANDGSITEIATAVGAIPNMVFPGKNNMYIYKAGRGRTISEYTKDGVFVRDITLNGVSGASFSGGLFNIDRSRFYYETRDQYGSEGKGYIDVTTGVNNSTPVQARPIHFMEPFILPSGFLTCDSYYNKYVNDVSGTGLIVGLGYISGYYARGVSSPDGETIYSLDSRNSPDEATLRKSNSVGLLIQQTNPTLQSYQEVYPPVALKAGLLLFTAQQSPPYRTYFVNCMDYSDNSQVNRMAFSKDISGVSTYLKKIIKYTA